MMEIRATELTESEVISLLELHHSEMQEFSPPGTCHVLDLTALKADDIEVFAAWDDTNLLAIGALRQHCDYAEIKSMRAHPKARRIGAGRAMLAHLIERARAKGNSVMKLETGSGELFEAAIGLYESNGFQPCEPFAGYTPGPFTRLYALELV